MKLCIWFVLLLALAPACAPGASPRPAAPGQGHATPGPGSAGHATRPAEPSCTPARSLDAQAATEEAACLLGHYLRIDTTNPPGNEIAGARFLAAVLAQGGIESRDERIRVDALGSGVLLLYDLLVRDLPAADSR